METGDGTRTRTSANPPPDEEPQTAGRSRRHESARRRSSCSSAELASTPTSFTDEVFPLSPVTDRRDDVNGRR
ncbi:hypothetical protein EYF80_033028 [Liparis tanakae]|uniref:Uncharacterized protein n=1 Tax=Liparis tanakae TaxID=230148 RepID=A0A4Z2GU77_9TELE|nr:hypothetical protein EYF80_033028 [Liparis tanakae]